MAWPSILPEGQRGPSPREIRIPRYLGPRKVFCAVPATKIVLLIQYITQKTKFLSGHLVWHFCGFCLKKEVIWGFTSHMDSRFMHTLGIHTLGIHTLDSMIATSWWYRIPTIQPLIGGAWLYSEICPFDHLYSEATSIQRPLGHVPIVVAL